MASRIDCVLFDLGGVLIEWNPRHLYRKLFADTAAMEQFLEEVCTPEWNARQDAGRDWHEAVTTLTHQFPEWADYIRAFDERWEEMVPGPVDGTAEIVRELHDGGVRLIALSNWSTQKFAVTRPRFAFLEWFESIVVSGDIGLVKPDPAIYRHCIDRFSLTPERTLFVDDSQPNVRAAEAVGLLAIRFTSAPELRAELVRLRLLEVPSSIAPSGADGFASPSLGSDLPRLDVHE